MSDGSSIEWTDATWQVTRGCSQVSPGCTNCYAQAFAHRGLHAATRGLTRATASGPRWTGELRLAQENLAQPLRWKKPRRIFVNSMSDLFHEAVPDEYIAAVFGVMAAAPQHTFQVLTKRTERMARWFEWIANQGEMLRAVVGEEPPPGVGPAASACAIMAGEKGKGDGVLDADGTRAALHAAWPLPNVWLGVSVENQEQADARIPRLLRTPAAVRFLSCEPLLGPVDLRCRFDCPTCGRSINVDEDGCCTMCGEDTKPGLGVDWVIVGGESGPGARPCAIEWIGSIADQCRAAGVPVFVKQLGAHVVSEERAERRPDGSWEWLWRAGLRDRKGGDPEEWLEELRVREFPAVRP